MIAHDKVKLIRTLYVQILDLKGDIDDDRRCSQAEQHVDDEEDLNMISFLNHHGLLKLQKNKNDSILFNRKLKMRFYLFASRSLIVFVLNSNRIHSKVRE